MSNQQPNPALATSSSDKPLVGAEGKRPYRQPRLTELGSVRELTLGATGSVGDGAQLQPSGG